MKYIVVVMWISWELLSHSSGDVTGIHVTTSPLLTFQKLTGNPSLTVDDLKAAVDDGDVKYTIMDASPDNCMTLPWE